MYKNVGIVAVGLTALSLFLTGCGGSDDPVSVGPAPAQSTAPQSGPQTEGSGGPPVTSTTAPDPNGPQKPPAGTIDRAKVLKYAKCMRDNGVKDFPDPDSTGALQMNGDAVNPNSPEFQKAQAECGSLMPGSAPTALSTKSTG